MRISYQRNLPEIRDGLTKRNEKNMDAIIILRRRISHAQTLAISRERPYNITIGRYQRQIQELINESNRIDRDIDELTRACYILARWNRAGIHIAGTRPSAISCTNEFVPDDEIDFPGQIAASGNGDIINNVVNEE
ncbi:hypothetical protein HCN44_007209 [Aphidius gifuensis]|uniref:Uncharacterized protein n=1 Tax=Aphidius gifuensis TaxID=684658 RepID=A0A834XM93_APHGI|nr:hypothetical protein HCN44_007208 [Aphidius gifuensis]KAF7988899.1 hypothetical protein HCN44_007209 [Aphidius gifuensis]